MTVRPTSSERSQLKTHSLIVHTFHCVDRSLLMATVAAGCSTSRARRAASSSSFLPGFYRALHSQTEANCFTAQPTLCPRLTLPQVAGSADLELPQGCYLVERLIATRKNKVCCAVETCKLTKSLRSGFGACGQYFFFSICTNDK